MFLEASIAIIFAKGHSNINEMLTPMVLVYLNKKVLTLDVMGTYPTTPPLTRPYELYLVSMQAL
jgi:hypothetical protein